jgi:uncharacterized protein
MSHEIIFQSGNREIYATIYGRSKKGVLLCPPHPNYGGSSQDFRLVSIAEELVNSGISAVCFDYSDYTGGTREVEDALLVLDSLNKTMDSLGLLGYSYGSVVAANAVSRCSQVKGLVLISPLMKIDSMSIDLTSSCKKLIIYGLQDGLIIKDIDALYDLASGEKQKISLDTDHFYTNYESALASACREFFQKTFNNL